MHFWLALATWFALSFSAVGIAVEGNPFCEHKFQEQALRTEGALLNQFLAASHARKLSLRMKIPKVGQIEIPFLLASQTDLTAYLETLATRSVSLGATRGWFLPGESSSRFHTWARVEDALMRLEPGPEGPGSPARAEALRYAAVQRGLLTREDGPVTFEILVPTPRKARSDLMRFFWDRSQGRATIGGNVVTPLYEERGCGRLEGAQTTEDNCFTFALSYLQPHWWRDYKGLRAFQRVSREVIRQDGRVGPRSAAYLLVKGRPLGVIAWIGRFSAKEPEALLEEFLEIITARKAYRISELRLLSDR